jgi:uncharacterized protein
MLSALFAAALATVTVHAPRADLTLEVARTATQRERGLMYRTQLAPHTGMIFVFKNDERVDFWMKNTLVSLDMVFVASDGTVRQVFARVPVVSPTLPDGAIPLEGARGKYVIELPAGEAARDGIAPGVRLDLHGVPAADSGGV